MGFKAALLRGLAGGGFAGATLRGLEPAYVPPVPTSITSTVSIRLRDVLDTDAIAKSYLTVAGADTIGAVDTTLGAWMSALDAVTGARIKEAVQTIAVPLPDGLKTVPDRGVMLNFTLSLEFDNDQDRKNYVLLVPAVGLDVVSGGGPDMTAGATIDRLAALLVNQVPGTTGGQFTTDRGGALTKAVEGWLSFHKRKRDLQPAVRSPG